MKKFAARAGAAVAFAVALSFTGCGEDPTSDFAVDGPVSEMTEPKAELVAVPFQTFEGGLQAGNARRFDCMPMLPNIDACDDTGELFLHVTYCSTIE